MQCMHACACSPCSSILEQACVHTAYQNTANKEACARLAVLPGRGLSRCNSGSRTYKWVAGRRHRLRGAATPSLQPRLPDAAATTPGQSLHLEPPNQQLDTTL